MISLNKIFITILSIVLFIFLINNTFIAWNYNKFEELNYKINEVWVKSMEFNENKIILSSWSLDNWLEINYLNEFNRLISYNSKYKFDNKSNNLLLEKWSYLINIVELNSEYNINWLWFKIANKWPLSLFIEVWIDQITFFSINSKVNINLINIENNKVINTLYLYPHNYIKIYPSQNKNVENADLLKLTQRFPINYFNSKILIENTINKDLISKLWLNKTEKEIEKIKNMFLFLYLDEINNNKLLNNLKETKFWTLIWEKFIKSYNILFLNENKKTVYYKNLIIRSLWDLVKVNWINYDKNEFLIKSLNELKELNIKEYNNMKEIVNYYSYLVLNSYKSDIKSKITFSDIYSKLDWKEKVSTNNYLLYLNDIYFEYDFSESLFSYKDLNTINNNNLKLLESEKSYFIFYINKILLSGFEELSKGNNIEFEDIIWLFNTYVNTSIDYYSIEDTVRIRTWLENYNLILKWLSKEIRKIYFKKDLDWKWYLIINKDKSPNLEKIKSLENNIKKIIEYYDNNKIVLLDRSKDELIKYEFEESRKIFNQYLLALIDYNSYLANYNEFLFWESINSTNEDKIISVNNAINFLNQFNYIDIKNVKISLRGINYCSNQNTKYDVNWLEEPYCYKIENLKIWWNITLNMILSPKESNSISNFVINWDKNINKWSYKLDNEKLIWDENYKRHSWNPEQEKSKFENFFLYVFNPPKEINITEEKEVEENSNLEEESVIVKIFKRNKLLWENWDFNIVNGFINIKYEDTIVKENSNSTFNINIKNSVFSYENLEIVYKWSMDSEYEFLPSHSFINPEFKFYDKYDSELYLWNKIKILWKFNINTSKDEFITIFWNFNNLNSALKSMEKILLSKNYNIIYEKESWIISIEEKDKQILLKIKWISISSLTYKWIEKLNKPVPIFNIEKTLELIK